MASEDDAILRPAWMYQDARSYTVNVYFEPRSALSELERSWARDVWRARGMRLTIWWRYRHPTTDDFQHALEVSVSQPTTSSHVIRAPGAVDYTISELVSRPRSRSLFETNFVIERRGGSRSRLRRRGV